MASPPWTSTCTHWDAIPTANILVEIDTMPGYEIDNAVLDKLRLAFDNAPVRNPIHFGQTEPGPDGIDLIIDASESPIPIPPEVQVYPPPQALPLTYPSWRRDFFGTQQDRSLPPQRPRAAVIAAKKLVFRYGVGIASAYVQGSDGQPGGVLYGRATSGPSDDFFISIGLMNSGEDRFNKQAAAIMHELGHCLGLRHGGDGTTSSETKLRQRHELRVDLPGDWNSTASAD